MKKNYKLYYATEENCFEGEKIAEFATFDDAKNCLLDNLKDDTDEQETLCNAELAKDSVYYSIELFNNSDYHVVYIITTDGRKARKDIAYMRKECIEINF